MTPHAISKSLQLFRRATWLALILCSGIASAQSPSGAALGTAHTTESACPPVAAKPSAEQIQAAARAARDRGFLWRLTKDGRVAYLYGTIHVGQLGWAFHGPQTQAALRASNTVALELDPADPAVHQAMAAYLAKRQSAAGAQPAWPPALRDRLSAQVRAACLPEAAMQGQHPVMQAMTLSVLNGRWDGLDPGYAQEQILSGYARAAGQSLVSLETIEGQLDVLMPSDPAQMLWLVDETLRQLENGQSRRTLSRLVQAWDRGQLDVLERYEQWCDCMDSEDDRAFMRRLNDERNPPLAQGIDALIAAGRSVFAAVGALHMIGPKGLPGLMAGLGYRVERVAFVQVGPM